MSSCNFMLSWVEHEKSFITSGPDIMRAFKAAYSVTMNIFRKKIIFFLNHLLK